MRMVNMWVLTEHIEDIAKPLYAAFKYKALKVYVKAQGYHWFAPDLYARSQEDYENGIYVTLQEVRVL